MSKLGRLADTTIQSETAALEHGSKQFKVSFDDLRNCYRNSAWAKANILIAVAGNKHDGTSGVRDAADTTVREEVEKFAHVIFASSSRQRDFWLGRGILGPDEVRGRFGELKPCLHGSDAHDHKTVGVPNDERYSWVKGALAFDSLRQACIEPERAYVGETPPIGASPSQVIRHVEISKASWAKTPNLELNPGLVAIIGPRGSGKTALADIIAAGCDALSNQVNAQSFLSRARDHLGTASVRLDWQDGDSENRALSDTVPVFGDSYPRARYLSQQFVNELCSSHGMTDALLREIERVIFDAHDLTARDGAVDFDDLLELRTARFRQARAREEQALASLSERIGVELEKHKLVVSYRTQVAEKTQLIARHEADRTKLVAKGSEERVTRLEVLTKAAESVRITVRHFNNREQQILLLQDEVADVRANRAPESLREIKQRHAASGLKSDDWPPFLMDFKGDVDKLLTERLAQARASVASWKGAAPLGADSNKALIPADANLEHQALALLEAEISRLEKLVSIDRDTTSKFTALSKKITEETNALERLKERAAKVHKLAPRSWSWTARLAT